MFKEKNKPARGAKYPDYPACRKGLAEGSVNYTPTAPIILIEVHQVYVTMRATSQQQRKFQRTRLQVFIGNNRVIVHCLITRYLP